MAQTTVSIRMDEALKQRFDHVCDELGMSMSTAIVIFAKKVIRENGIPFSVSYDPFYSDSNIEALHESIEQMKAGKYVTKTLAELEAMADE